MAATMVAVLTLSAVVNISNAQRTSRVQGKTPLTRNDERKFLYRSTAVGRSVA